MEMQPAAGREFLKGLANLLYEKKCTGILISETSQIDGFETVVADGIITLGNFERRGDILRVIQVVKMSGAGHSRSRYVTDSTSLGLLLTRCSGGFDMTEEAKEQVIAKMEEIGPAISAVLNINMESYFDVLTGLVDNFRKEKGLNCIYIASSVSAFHDIIGADVPRHQHQGGVLRGLRFLRCHGEPGRGREQRSTSNPQTMLEKHRAQRWSTCSGSWKANRAWSFWIRSTRWR